MNNTKTTFMSAHNYPLVYPAHLSLMPFQETACQELLRFLKDENIQCAAYSALEQGLGKTIISITLLNSLDAKKTLVIAPASLVYVWPTKLKEWLTEKRRVLVIETSKNLTLSAVDQADIVVVSYDLASKAANHKVLCSFNWDLLLLDESHKVKNRQAIRTQMVLGASSWSAKAKTKGIWECAHYKIAMSGTPFRSSVMDGWPLFHKMAPHLFPSYHKYGERYTNIKRTPWGLKYDGVKNAPQLRQLTRSNFLVRYLKKDVLPQLPDKTWELVSIPEKFSLKFREKQEEKRLKLEALDLEKAIKRNNKFKVPPAIATHRKAQAMEKLPFVVDYVAEMLEQEIPLVVFAYHREFISKLSIALQSYKPVVITGDTSPKEREQIVAAFQNGKTNLIILQIIAGGEGITLTRSWNCVLAEIDWSTAVVDQAVDRVHRIGQNEKVIIHYFIVEDSIEGRIEKVLMESAKNFRKVIDGDG